MRPMPQKLLTRTQFAKLAGTNVSTTTRVCRTLLAPAFDGKRIDVDHPAAVAYLKKRADAMTPPPATGVDPFHEKAVEHCRRTGRWTASNLQRGLKIGYNRARALITTFEAAGLPPKPGEPEPPPPPPAPRKPHGGTVVHEQKKSATHVPGPHVLPEHIESFRDWTLQQIVDQFGTDVQFLDFLKSTKAICDIAEKDLKNAKTRGELVSREVVKVGIIDPINSAHIKLLTDGAKSIAVRSMAMAAADHDVKDIETYIATAIGKFIKPVKAKVARALRNA